MPSSIDPQSLKVSKQEGKQIVRSLGTIAGNQFVIDNLKECEVLIFDHCDSLYIDDCSNCKFVIGPTSGSVFIRDTHSSSFIIASQQLRTRDCKDLTINLFCPTEPIVESSTGVCFSPWNVAIPNAEELFEKAHLRPTDKNLYYKVHDFSKSDVSIPEPHWTSDATVTELVTYDVWACDGLQKGQIPVPLRSSLRDDLNTRTVVIWNADAVKLTGLVKWYDRKKGFGYAESSEGQILIYRRVLQKGMKLVPHASVEVMAKLQPKGWCAQEILSCDAPAEAPAAEIDGGPQESAPNQSQQTSAKKKKQKGKKKESKASGDALDGGSARANEVEVRVDFYLDSMHPRMLTFLKESDMYIKSLDNRQMLRKQIEFDPTSILVAIRGEDIVGTVYVLYHPWQALIYHLCVHPQHRDLGVANLLMERAEQLLKSRGTKCPTTFVEAKNSAAIAFYEKRGWFHAQSFLCMGKSLQ